LADQARGENELTQQEKPLTVEVQQDAGCGDLPLPEYQTQGSAGMDLRAAVEHPVTLEPGKIAMVPTGLRVAIPAGYEAQVRPRSGLALKHGVTVLNTPGTVDSDYRGPVNVILCNLGPSSFEIRRGDRIAQMVVTRVERIEWKCVESVNETERGSGGFGHTGLQ
jgi:dUTP pyrophosphatase